MLYMIQVVLVLSEGRTATSYLQFGRGRFLFLGESRRPPSADVLISLRGVVLLVGEDEVVIEQRHRVLLDV